MRLQKAELEACDEEPAPEAIETENPPKNLTGIGKAKKDD